MVIVFYVRDVWYGCRSIDLALYIMRLLWGWCLLDLFSHVWMFRWKFERKSYALNWYVDYDNDPWLTRRISRGVTLPFLLKRVISQPLEALFKGLPFWKSSKSQLKSKTLPQPHNHIPFDGKVRFPRSRTTTALLSGIYRRFLLNASSTGVHSLYRRAVLLVGLISSIM